MDWLKSDELIAELEKHGDPIAVYAVSRVKVFVLFLMCIVLPAFGLAVLALAGVAFLDNFESHEVVACLFILGGVALLFMGMLARGSWRRESPRSALCTRD